MGKPKTLFALKNMYQEWPNALGYPMLISGMDLTLKSVWLNQDTDVNYKISFSTTHKEIEKLVLDSDLPESYRFGHEQLENIIPRSTREEVLAIALYNTLLYGINDTYIDNLGTLSIVDYQVPVVSGKSQDIGCIDIFGLLTENEHKTYRPVIIELKGQIEDTDKTRRDCPHFALLEAWIYFILFYRNKERYKAQLTNSIFKELEGNKIDWKNPVIAILGSQEYWEYWDRSDKKRGYNGLGQFHDCCAYLSHIYSQLFDKIEDLDVVALSLRGAYDSTFNKVSRDQIQIIYDNIERINSRWKHDEFVEKICHPVKLQWSESYISKKPTTRKKFRDQECEKQINFKLHSQYVQQAAKNKGYYQGHPVDYCFPDKYADEIFITEYGSKL